MEAIILAGGLGTRLRDVVVDVPKPMAKVCGRPFLEILLHNLEAKGFDRVILSLGYLADNISGYFGSSFGNLDLYYEVEATPLGTGGALRASLSKCLSNHAFIFNGDTFIDLEVECVEAFWTSHQNPIIVACKVPDMSRYGQLHIESGRVVEFLPKGGVTSGLINAGCYVLPKNILDGYELGLPFSLEADFLVNYVRSNPVELFVSDGRFIDIGVPEDYLRAQIELNHL